LIIEIAQGKELGPRPYFFHIGESETREIY